MNQNQPPQNAFEQARSSKVRVPKNPMDGFMDFIRQQGVVGLAVGLVLGTQIKVVVDTFIASFLDPILGLILPGAGNLNQKVFVLDARGKTAEFAWGEFISVIISFITVAVIIYYIVKTLRLDKLAAKK